MDFLHILALAILQGLTEFLPISSSAHLILLPQVAGWADQGLAFDVALHLGSLLAVLAYFRKDLMPLMRAWLDSLRGQGQTPHSRLVWAVGFATIPVGLGGLLFNHWAENALRNPLIIAVSTLVFGLLLGLADFAGSRRRDEYTVGWRDVLVIGLAQAVAIIPGTSRSGITMTAGLFMGLTRQAAARFSFLLSIPVIILAGGWETVKLVQQAAPVDWSALALGTLFSGISAYLCIHLFLRFIERVGMWPFVLYRLILGVALLVFWL